MDFGAVILAVVESLIATIITDSVKKDDIWSRRRSRDASIDYRERLREELLKKYSDTSLDTGAFCRFVENGPFREMLKQYLFEVDEQYGSKYLELFIGYICQQCPNVNSIEVREFIQDIVLSHSQFYKQVIEGDSTLSALYKLIAGNQRKMLNAVVSRQEELKSYLELFVNRRVEIDDSDIQLYHEVCKRHFGFIRFTGIERAASQPEVSLEQFYVKNTFSLYRRVRTDLAEDTENFSIGLESLFQFGNKIVIIGGAGFGKTTTLNYLFCNYEELYSLHALKLKIDLKEYAKRVENEDRSILRFLANEFKNKITRAGNSIRDWEEILSQYLREGRCLVIFDALDEISNEASRTKVRDDVSQFCEVYKYNRFIVSSREVGYLRNKFDHDFVHFRIDLFDEEQISEYCDKWLKSKNRSEKECEKFKQHFQEEVKRANCEELIQNPIILVLALIIFDHTKNLPNCRVEFYKGCVETFLETREKQKDTKLSDKAKNILSDELLLPKVAYYKFENDDGDYSFNSQELREAIFQALELNDAGERRDWQSAIKDFETYLVERTELIREIDENSLDFAHKTFYEYFLANYFVKAYEEDLTKLLEKWIGSPDYHELACLLIEVILHEGKSKEKKEIVDFLFELASIKEKRAIFTYSILSNLYIRALLPAKYHRIYHGTLLSQWDIVGFRISRAFNNKNYDPNQMAEEYWKLFECRNDNNFRNIAPALISFGENFVAAVENEHDEAMQVLVKYSVETTFVANNIRTMKIQNGFILYLLGICNDSAYVQKILLHSKFIRTVKQVDISPATFKMLLQKGVSSAESILLVLIGMILSSNPDSMVEWSFRNIEKEDSLQIMAEIWKGLFCASSLEEWTEWFSDYGIYHEGYTAWYQMLYNKYFGGAGKKDLFEEIEWNIKRFYKRKRVDGDVYMDELIRNFENDSAIRREKRMKARHLFENNTSKGRDCVCVE